MDSRFSIFKVAIISRLLILALTIGSSVVSYDYDISTRVLDTTFNECSQLSLAILGPLLRWDALYFLEIAQNGYTLEQQFAFFPGYPLMINTLSQFIPGCERVALIVSGLFVSNISFVLAALALFNLSMALKLGPRISRNASLIFCISPASVFMSSIYTESLFALLSFQGMYYLAHGSQMIAALTFALASSVRSNGILFAGFYIYGIVIIIAKHVKTFESSKIKGVKKSKTNKKSGWDNIARLMNMKTCTEVLKCVLCCIIIVAPFVAFQLFAYQKFCADYSGEWCANSIPTVYSFVQKRYWNNGLLNYYTKSQLPNFVLASPIFIIHGIAIHCYYKYDRLRFLSIGLLDSKKSGIGYVSSRTLPHIFLALFMTLYCALFMHVQVVIRFCTSLPIVYWFLADSSRSSEVLKPYVYYSFIYASVGAILFGSFLPPA